MVYWMSGASLIKGKAWLLLCQNSYFVDNGLNLKPHSKGESERNEKKKEIQQYLI